LVRELRLRVLKSGHYINVHALARRLHKVTNPETKLSELPLIQAEFSRVMSVSLRALLSASPMQLLCRQNKHDAWRPPLSRGRQNSATPIEHPRESVDPLHKETKLRPRRPKKPGSNRPTPPKYRSGQPDNRGQHLIGHKTDMRKNPRGPYSRRPPLGWETPTPSN
jgi:hypothetical protein